ncbi:MAG: FAD-dependent oxidoreductase [Acidimicrobiia bacterium]|nr:FAD-dependent oxidoreductase [Acidimicrobiia bacterium]
MRIAIIGTGIAGLGAAHRLRDAVDLTLFEANDWVGGHTHTVDVALSTDESVPVDTGFIVYNESTYPLLTKLFADLHVATEPSDMSFSVRGPAGEYEGSARGMFVDRRALVDPSHWAMIRDILAFNRRVNEVDLDQLPPGLTLGAFTADLSQSFQQRYLLPMGAAIWSTPANEMFDYPADTLVRFFRNHGLAQLRDRPAWRTVTGGSRTYVEALTKPFCDRIRLKTPVQEIRRGADGVDVVTPAGIERFDGVLLATHADTSLKILNGWSSPAEQNLLSNFQYARNEAVLHTDPSLMPASKRAWASWNVVQRDPFADPSLTYWMNRLQNLETPKPVFVTLNPDRMPGQVHGSWMYDHPMFDARAVEAQRHLSDLQGSDRVWFAGAYFRYGFHEDGLMAGYAAADSILQSCG